jgi:hypothetical protein
MAERIQISITRYTTIDERQTENKVVVKVIGLVAMDTCTK